MCVRACARESETTGIFTIYIVVLHLLFNEGYFYSKASDKNKPMFYEKQHVVFRRHFRSIGKILKLGIRYERLKNRDHQRFAQERGAECSYSTQKCLKLYCRPFSRNDGLCFLRYKTFYQYGV